MIESAQSIQKSISPYFLVHDNLFLYSQSKVLKTVYLKRINSIHIYTNINGYFQLGLFFEKTRI